GKSVKEATVTRLSADVPAHPMSAKQTDQRPTRTDSVPSKSDSLQQLDHVAQCQSDPALSQTTRVVNVPFGNGAEEPTKRAQDDIRTLARKIQESGRDVTVRGRPSGPDDFALARSRANSIRAILMQGGVTPTRITVTTDSSPKPGGDVFYSEIIYGTSSSGFVLLDGC
ncbi:MAG: CpaD family pilus assembly lipoprotein, partial [Georgfuchsia sp.]